MPELVIYRGLPASGKTTLAKAWVAENPAGRARVNRDDLRRMLHDGVYLGHDTERHVAAARDRLIGRLLAAGLDVCSDDTNLPSRTVRDLMALARGAATVRVVDLTHITFAICVARDHDREYAVEGTGVGEDVIRRMYERYVKGRPSPLPVPSTAGREHAPPEAYAPRPGLPRAIMVDLDGTLCLHDGRSPYDETLVSTDLPNRAVVEAIRAALCYDGSLHVIFCSGRSENARADTVAWIDRHLDGLGEGGVGRTHLLMRAAGDQRKDAVVKRELFDARIRDQYDVLYVLDDRQQVVDAWREIGLTVFQVAPGNF